MKITPGLAPEGQGRWGPVHDYYVVFWKQPLIRDADRLAGATQEDIMWAAAEQHPEITALLLEFGADVRARSVTYPQIVVNQQTQRAGRE